MFQNFDWSNVVMAGGSVLSCLLSSPASDFTSTDIDLFIYGLNVQQAREKVMNILATIEENTKKKCHLVISDHSITVIGVYPLRHVQIVLRLYR